MKHCLLVESSLPGVAVGLFSFSGTADLLSFQTSDSIQGTVQNLSVMTVNCLNEAGLKLSDLDGIGVSVGPGSYTGIRAGLAYSYGMMQGQADHFRGLLGLSSLHLLCSDLAESQNTEIELLLGSTRDSGFRAFSSTESSSAETVKISNYFSNLSQNKKLQRALLGTWREFALEAGKKELHYDVLLPSQFLYMSLKAMASHCRKLGWQQLEFSKEMPVPLYLRASTAEEKSVNEKGTR